MKKDQDDLGKKNLEIMIKRKYLGRKHLVNELNNRLDIAE